MEFIIPALVAAAALGGVLYFVFRGKSADTGGARVMTEPTHAEMLVAIEGIRGDIKVIKNDVHYIKEGVKVRTDLLQDHEKRIQSVEKRMWWFSGAAAVLATILGRFWDKVFGQ